MIINHILLNTSAIRRPARRAWSGVALPHSPPPFYRLWSARAPIATSIRPRNLSTRVPTALSQVSAPGAKGRVFIFRSSATDPYINLSLEHYLLQHAHPESRILFLYVNRPCVVIGRNQNPWVECALRKLTLEPLGGESDGGTGGGSARGSGIGGRDDGHHHHPEVLLVRRRSGGGAVFHDDGNLNYSVIVPSHAKAEFKRKTHAEMVARAVRGVQRDLAGSSATPPPAAAAVETEIQLDSGTVERTNVRVNDRNDIVMDDPQRGILKVSGSAFKLTKGRALHHGTLLFASPHVERIGEFLRSPARRFISAKGVESVRSPVGNLFDLPERSARQREILRWRLEMGIADEFRKMYGEEVNARASPVVGWEEEEEEGSEAIIIRRQLSEDISTEVDGRAEARAEIIKGVREIDSPEWKFEQTPGFVVSTAPVESEKGFSPPTNPDGLPDGARILFRVKHGVVQEAELILSHEEGALTQEDKQTGARLQGQKLHEICDWQAIFDSPNAGTDAQSRRLAHWLSDLFPPLFPNTLHRSEPEPGREKMPNETSGGRIVKRRRVDGVVEVDELERSDNTPCGRDST